jgi:dimethylargininase
VTIHDATSPLRRVYVRPPDERALSSWRDYGWHAAPDPRRAEGEHAALRQMLADAGASVEVGTTPVPGDPDAMYAFDALLPLDDGVIALHPGKPGRRGEPDVLAADLDALGIPTIGRLSEPATAEGGDLCFLRPDTLLAGVGYRTNVAGVEQLRALLTPRGIDVLAFDLPHLHGPEECLHLLSVFSLLDADLAVAYPPLMPARLVQLFDDRGVKLVTVPEEEFASQGPNVLALGPRVALALEGNPETKRRMEAAGVEVRTYRGEEISRKGDGGPTCLTRPLERG